MASKFAWLSTVCMFATVGMVCGGGAPPPGGGGMVDCSSVILELADCLTFVEQGSKLVKPEQKCCSGLTVVVKKEVGCLCEAFKKSGDFGIKINMTKGLTLPQACGVSTPPLSKCKIAVAVGGSPASAPAPSPVTGGSVVEAPVPAPGGAGEHAGAASLPIVFMPLLSCVAMVISSLFI